ncbi:MAG: GTP cyclohydrolase I FolE2 [Nanoarchaeota archaeon]|nr:GTP cyclohydrolase I FolE2 [Nanoarchaeota archaeon]
MKDIQNSIDKRKLSINKTGIKHLIYPMKIACKGDRYQTSVCEFDMFITLPHNFKGTHMSRFIEIVEKYRTKIINLDIIGEMAEDIMKKLEAKSAEIKIIFPFFIEKTSPISKKKSLLNYQCRFVCAIKGNTKENILEVRVPITTLCPCSKEISKNGAHNQRSHVMIRVNSSRKIWIEDIIKLVEKQAPCEIFTLLKRDDEKYVTEKAYKNPKFVEDIVRDIVFQIKKDKNIIWYGVGVLNEESIHNHDAFGYIEGGKTPKCIHWRYS